MIFAYDDGLLKMAVFLIGVKSYVSITAGVFSVKSSLWDIMFSSHAMPLRP